MPSHGFESRKHVSNCGIPGRALPKAWPPGVIYLTSPKYSANIDHGLLHVAKHSPEASVNPVISLKPQAPFQVVRVKAISDPSHPANGQHGLFATQHLHPDTFVIAYLGFVHGAVDADPTSDYDLRLEAEREIAVDASRMGNEARFVNDYRGVSATGPNAEFRDVLFDFGNGMLERGVGVYVLSAGKVKNGKRAKGITKGEEILVSYGKGFWSGRKGDQQAENLPDGT